MAFAVVPMTLALAMVAFMPSFTATAFVLFAFFFAYYIYEPPYRGLYPDSSRRGLRASPGRAAHHARRGDRRGARRRRVPPRAVGAVTVRSRRGGQRDRLRRS